MGFPAQLAKISLYLDTIKNASDIRMVIFNFAILLVLIKVEM
jgi:hypothetical protein